MNLNLKQILIPLSSAIVGGLIVFAGLKLTTPNPATTDTWWTSKPSHEFSFDNILKKHSEIGNQFESMFKMESPFERLDPVITEGISEREDEEAIYYDIKVDDVKSTSIDTKVNNGYLTITGTTEKKTVSGDNENNDVTAGSVYRSTFNKTFPLPDHIDPNKMQMITEKDKIVLKFPKIKA